MSVFLQDILAGCKEALSLSSQSGAILQRLNCLSPQRSVFLGSSSGTSSPGLSDEVPASFSSTGSSRDVTVKNDAVTATVTLKAEREQASLLSTSQ